MRVAVIGEKLWGTRLYLYRVYVDGKERETMTSTTNLTLSQQQDMADSYAEALEGYVLGGK